MTNANDSKILYVAIVQGHSINYIHNEQLEGNVTLMEESKDL